MNRLSGPFLAGLSLLFAPVAAGAAITTPGPSLNPGGAVIEAVMAPDGSWILGGTFTSVGGVPRNNLARVLADGTVDPNWAPNPDATVEAVAVSGGNVYFGGWFGCTGVVGSNDGDCSDAGEVPRASIAMAPLAGSGAVDATWNPGTSHIVQSIVPCGAFICVGGSFGQVNGGTPRSGLFRTAPTGNGTADPAWNPNANDTVRVLVADGEDLYVGGDFTTINGATPRRRAARVSLTSGLADAWNPSVDNIVHAIRPMGDSVFIGGDFQSVNGGFQPTQQQCMGTPPFVFCFDVPSGPRTNPLDYLARAARDGAGAVDETWRPTPNNVVRGLSVSGGSLLVAGHFTSFAGGPSPVARGRLAALSPSTAEVGPWNPGLDSFTSTVATGNGMVVTGGPFTQVAGAGAGGVAFLAASFPPAVPTGASASQPPGADASLDVSFASGDSGNAIATYSVTCTSGTGGISGTAVGAASPIRVTGLTAGATYTCVVSASNGAGSSASASDPSAPVTTREAPVSSAPPAAPDTPITPAPAPFTQATTSGDPTAAKARNRGRSSRARQSMRRAPVLIQRLDRGRLVLTGRFAFRERGRFVLQVLSGRPVASARAASGSLCTDGVRVAAGRPVSPRCLFPVAAVNRIGGRSPALRVDMTFTTRDGIVIRSSRVVQVPAGVLRTRVAVTG